MMEQNIHQDRGLGECAAGWCASGNFPMILNIQIPWNLPLPAQEGKGGHITQEDVTSEAFLMAPVKFYL